MLWVLKRTVSMRRFFWAPKTYIKIDRYENIHNFTLNYCVYLDLWNLMYIKSWASAWDFQQCGMCHQQRLKSACAYAQSDQSLRSSPEYSMNVKLLTEHLLEVLSSKGGCTGSSESTLVKMSHCWKSHAMAHLSCCSKSSHTFSPAMYVEWTFNASSRMTKSASVP